MNISASRYGLLLRSFVRASFNSGQGANACYSCCLQRKTPPSKPMCAKMSPIREVRKMSVASKVEITETEEPDKLYRGIDIFLKGHEDSVLESYCTFASIAAEELGIKVANILEPKYITDRITLLKSIHVHKKHRVQYEAQTHKRVIQLQHLTGSTADAFLSYLQINIPAGVAMHVHKWAIESLPKHVEEAMEAKRDQMTPEDEAVAEKFKARMADSKLTTNLDYEEYKTTKPYLIGTTI